MCIHASFLLSIFRHFISGPCASKETTRYGTNVSKNMAYGLVEPREQKGDTFRVHASGTERGGGGGRGGGEGGEVSNEYEDIVSFAPPLSSKTAGKEEGNVLSFTPTKMMGAITTEEEAFYEDIR